MCSRASTIVPVAQERRPQHVQPPGLHREVARGAEHADRLAELVLAVAREGAEVFVIADPPQRVRLAAQVADPVVDLARLGEIAKPDPVGVRRRGRPRP